MDDDGFAYPSLRTWAAGAVMSPNTLVKHYRTALREGWLGVQRKHEGGGKAWKLNQYRAAIPCHIELPEKDAALSDALMAAFGEIEGDDSNAGNAVTSPPVTHLRDSAEAVSLHADTPSEPTCVTHADTPTRLYGEAVSSHVDTPSANSDSALAETEGVSNAGVKVCQNTPLRVSKVCQRNRVTPCPA
jgi:hypothetical protein